MIRNKKGDFTDGLVLIFVLFTGVVLFLIYSYVFSQVAISLNNTIGQSNETVRDSINQYYDITTNSFNMGYAMFFGGLIIVEIASSFLIFIHPIFSIVYILMLFINTFFAILLHNAFETLKSSSALSLAVQQQTVLVFVMEHLVAISISVSVLTMLIIFAKFIYRGNTQ